MRTYQKISLNLIAFLVPAVIWLAWPGDVLAQEPDTNYCVSINGQLIESPVVTLTIPNYYGSGLSIATVDDWYAIDPVTMQYGCDYDPAGYYNGSRDGGVIESVDCGARGYTNRWKFSLYGPNIRLASPITGTQTLLRRWPYPTTEGDFPEGMAGDLFCNDNGTGWQELTVNINLGGDYLSSEGRDCQGIAILGNSTSQRSNAGLIVECGTGQYPDDMQLYTCPTVEDWHFEPTETLTDTWLLSGAVITDGILTLAPGDIAAQNLDSLSSETSYNAVISVTSAISNPVLTMILGTQSEQLTITGTGIFSANFTTPVLAGPLAYALQSVATNTGSIEIDYTCLYRTDDSDNPLVCIAPTNGEFTTDEYWNWFTSSRWWTPAQAAFLPHTDVGMIQTAQTYTMPTLADGEYLLISFEANSETNSGIIGGRVSGGVVTATNVSYFYFETYPSTYHYESDISNLSGSPNTEVMMGNVSETPPDGYDGTGIDNIVLDNVCIFVSNDPPQLPYAIDEDQPKFVNFGLNYTSCADIDGLWAWYGVNMAQYRADYNAGASVWDPIGWVPWLISAIWVNLASWSCLVMDLYAAFLSTIEYLLNNFLNFVFWLLESWENFRDWLNGWGLWLALSIANILLALFPWLGDLGGWLAESGLNWAAWAWSVLSVIWNWLATYFFNLNGLRIIINWLIEYGWNPFMAGLGVVLSALLDVFIYIWNSGLLPVLLSFLTPLGFISLMPSLAAMILNLIYSAWDLIYTLFMWLWENVISVGHIPLSFYYSFDEAMNSTAYSALVSCTGLNFWCTFLAGVQIVNQTVAHSIFYPIVIVGIVLSTIWVIWQNIKELFSINIQ